MEGAGIKGVPGIGVSVYLAQGRKVTAFKRWQKKKGLLCIAQRSTEIVIFCILYLPRHIP